MYSIASSEASPITYQPMKQATKTCTLTIDGTEYKCDITALEQSGLRERYTGFHYIDQGWYSRIYETVDLIDASHWALKVIRKEDWQSRFEQDIKNFALAKDEKAIIQCREHHDLGQTGVLVVEWADGDMHYRRTPFHNIKTDRAFRVLARQLLEGIETLDRLGLYHDSLGEYDFLYVKNAGRVKLSALERAVQCHTPNIKALAEVYDALEPFSRKLTLSDASNNLLSTLKGGQRVAADLLKHEVFTALPDDISLDL